MHCQGKLVDRETNLLAPLNEERNLDRVEILRHIQFQKPSVPRRVVLRPPERRLAPFPSPTRKGVLDQPPLEIRLARPDQRVMQHPLTETRCVDAPLLGLGLKRLTLGGVWGGRRGWWWVTAARAGEEGPGIPKGPF